MPEKKTTTSTTKKSEASEKSTAKTEAAKTTKSTAKTTTKTAAKSTKTATKETEAKSTTAKKKQEKAPKEFQGEFTPAIGRRKRSVAQVRVYPKGSGAIVVNDKKIEDFFDEDRIHVVYQPLKLTGQQKDMDISILVKGGGIQGQAEAARLGISRALIKHDADLTATLKAKGWTTRDPRRVERKKPGLKKARRAPQWSKR